MTYWWAVSTSGLSAVRRYLQLAAAAVNGPEHGTKTPGGMTARRAEVMARQQPTASAQWWKQGLKRMKQNKIFFILFVSFIVVEFSTPLKTPQLPFCRSFISFWCCMLFPGHVLNFVRFHERQRQRQRQRPATTILLGKGLSSPNYPVNDSPSNVLRVPLAQWDTGNSFTYIF